MGQAGSVRERSVVQGFVGPDAPAEKDLYTCVHCGLCLTACPTYLETGLETESPRGRIALMRAVYEGRLALTREVVRHWDLCLACRACEAVCPSGVPYGRLIEHTRAQVLRHLPPPLWVRWGEGLVFRHLLPYPGRLRLGMRLLRWYQRLGVQGVVRRTGLLRPFPLLHRMDSLLPPLPSHFFSARGQVYAPRGTPRGRVALLSGCVMPLVHAATMRACVRVLTHNGWEVVVPRSQVCCGALHVHSGRLEEGRNLARHNIQAFLETQPDAIIVASAGCGSTMKEYGHLLKDDSRFATQAREFSTKVKDIHEFLVSSSFTPPQAPWEITVTYQEPCHLAHAQRISQAPRRLLRSIPGLRLVEMHTPAKCCGAAGSYQIFQREMSERLAEDKLRDALSTGAQVLATANPGCALQLEASVQRRRLPLRVAYVIDLLDEAYQREAEGAS
ncbi:MAG: (Fe-S)-binding protein [Dehalococcoidia bacterium]|nr:(Fe-S)-binding protein [Dehalococcoidia bacterium]MDW8119718.1 (Fe-S)-binding protein [Chloroflexota bacterium]